MNENLKKLRELTSASMLECKKALIEANNDLNKATELLKVWGKNVSAKKESRITGDGTIVSYIHSTGKVGVLVELKCETDFVARNEEFKNFGMELAMQVAAMNPLFIKSEDFKEDQEKKIDSKEVCLYLQPYIKNPSQTVKDFIDSYISKFGEKIEVARFVRFEI